MQDWQAILAIVVPMLMNWWEVRGLRKEIRADLKAMDARHVETTAGLLASQAALDMRITAVEKRLGYTS